MVCLGNEIYCKLSVLTSALGAATNGRQLARRLINGIFKLEAVLESTWSGTKCRRSREEVVDQEQTTTKVLHRDAANVLLSKQKF